MAEWYMGVLGIYPLCQIKNEYVKFASLAGDISKINKYNGKKGNEGNGNTKVYC